MSLKEEGDGQVQGQEARQVTAGAGSGGALYLIFIQIVSRALTFIGNQILLRYLTPSLLGISIQLELLSTSVLYFARESLRVALQRQSPSEESTESKDLTAGKSSNSKTQTRVNLSYLAIALGLLVSVAFGVTYLFEADTEVLESSSFGTAFTIYGIATLLELLSEPSFVVIQQYGLFEARARAETGGAIMRCILACLTAGLMHQYGIPASVLPFAVGQLAYAFFLLFGYATASVNRAQKQDFSLLPHMISGPSYVMSLFDKTLLSLSGTLYVQSVFKLLLTEGDHLILSFFASLADQGAFALAANYGGLLARLVFQPIEESSRNLFGRYFSSTTSGKADPKLMAQGYSHLSMILHFYLLLAIPLVTVAPYILPLLVSVLMGSKWQTHDTAALLSTYCYYIPFMAINGVLDAFVTSVATPAQLSRQSAYMAGFTIIYGAVSWVCLGPWQLGAPGLVVANMVNMSMRITWSVWFIDSWVTEHSGQGNRSRQHLWSNSFPAISNAVAAGGAAAYLYVSTTVQSREDFGMKDFGHVVVAGILLASTILFTEREFLVDNLEHLVPQRLASSLPRYLKSSKVRQAK